MPNKQNFKGRKGNDKFKKPFKKDKVEDIEKEVPTKFNDVEWYTKNKDLIDDSANISFGNPAGATLIGKSYGLVNGNVLSREKVNEIAGICIQLMFPTIGDCTSDRNVPDIAAKSLYSWVRHQNSGHANYESSDLEMYLLSMREIYSYLGYLIGTYGLINLYSATNRYVPKALLKARGIDADDVVNHRADFLFFINSFIAKVNSLCVPSELPLFKKAFWIYSQVYSEDKYGKSQLYMYVPATFMKFTGTKATTGSALVNAWINGTYFNDQVQPIISNRTYLKVDDLIQLGSALIDPLLSDEDIGIMSGDILKAFGRDKCFLMSPIDANLVTTPVGDSFVLQQFHNATPVSIDLKVATNVDDLRPGNIVQKDNVIMQVVPIADQTTPKWTDYVIADIDSDAPTTEELIEATQHAVLVGKIDAGLKTNYFSVIGWGDSDYVIKYNSDYISVGFVVIDGLTGLNPKFGIMRWDILTDLPYAETPFNFTPVAKYIYAQSDSALHEVHLINVKYNYAAIRDTVIANMHYASMLSLFAVPAVKHLSSTRF